MRNQIKEKPKHMINYVICSALFPFVLIGYQYQQNIEYLSFWHVLALCLLLSGFMIGLYYLSRLIILSDFGAFLFSGILFTLFFTYRGISSAVQGLISATGLPSLHQLTEWLYGNKWSVLFIGIIGALFIILIHKYICRRFKDILDKRIIAVVSLVVVLVMLAQNIVVIIIFATQQQSDDVFYKETFVVDVDIKESPNIYWIHTDGMLGFDSMYRFFGYAQEDFARELEMRGFFISRDAAFAAQHSTQWALPTLLNPFYYDRVLSWHLDPEYAAAITLNKDLLNDSRLRLDPNVISNRIARERNETVMAFNVAGYNTGTITSGLDMYFFPTVRQYYAGGTLMTTTQSLEDVAMHVGNISSLRSLIDLLSMISPLPNSEHHVIAQFFRFLNAREFTSVEVATGTDLFGDLDIDEANRKTLNTWNRRVDSLYDMLGKPSPRFVIFDFGLAHFPFVYDELGVHNDEDANNPMRYPAHHTFSTKVLLKVIDIILEDDPDAIIVLQADHGLHGVSHMGGIDELMRVFSSTEGEISALWNGVMSAVRLPEEDMTPETLQILSDPRNISRYLVNNFVGENYEYIPPEFRQVFRGPER